MELDVKVGERSQFTVRELLEVYKLIPGVMFLLPKEIYESLEATEQQKVRLHNSKVVMYAYT